jgi:hypothetical protein
MGSVHTHHSTKRSVRALLALPILLAGLGVAAPAHAAASATIDIVVPAEGAVYVLGETLVPSYTCSFAVAAVATTCRDDLATGATLTGSPGDHTFTVTATDAEGTATSLTVAYEVVGFDTTAPTITVSSPTSTSIVKNTVVNASFTCSDNVAIESCIATSPNGTPIDTATIGAHAFQVVAIDTSGNQATKTVEYTVIDAPLEPVAPLHWFEITSPGGWRQFLLGTGTRHVWAPRLSPAAARTNIELRLRDMSGTSDFSKLFVRPQSDAVNMVPIARYITPGTDTTKWFTVTIPLADFPSGSFDNITEIAIYHRVQNGNVRVGLGGIVFTGGTAAPFEWFGDSKFDNAYEARADRGQMGATFR